MSEQTRTLKSVAEGLAGGRRPALRLLIDTLLDELIELEPLTVDEPRATVAPPLEVARVTPTPTPTPVPAPPPAAPMAAKKKPDEGPPVTKTLVVEDAAAKLRVSVSAIHDYTRAGYMRRWPPGRTYGYLIPVEDIEAFEAGGGVAGEPRYEPQQFAPKLAQRGKKRGPIKRRATTPVAVDTPKPESAPMPRKNDGPLPLPPELQRSPSNGGAKKLPPAHTIHPAMSMRDAQRLALTLGCEVNQGELIKFVPPKEHLALGIIQIRHSDKDAGRVLANWLRKLRERTVNH